MTGPTATFAATPNEFFSFVTSTDYASAVQVAGRNNIGSVIGTDGGDYVVLSCANAGFSPKTCFSLWNIRTGANHAYTDTALSTFFGLTVPQDAAVVPVNGTPYIWFFWTEGTNHATFIWRGVIAQVHDTDTLSIPTDIGQLAAESPGLESWGDTELSTCVYNPVTGYYRVFLYNIVHGTVAGHRSTCPYFDIAVHPDNSNRLTTEVWSNPIEPTVVDNTFFNLLSISTPANILTNGATSFGVNDDGSMYMLFYIGELQWEYIQANPTASVSYPFITGVGVYRYDFPTSIGAESPADPGIFTWFIGTGDTITGPLTGMDFSDSNRHLDGTVDLTASPTNRPPNDYAAINIYEFPDISIQGQRSMSFSEIGSIQYLDFPSSELVDTNRYIVMARSYTSSTDLNTAGTGSYIRCRVWRYNSATPLVATEVLDQKFSTFDTMADLGALIGDKLNFQPNFVQTVQAANKDFFYVMGQPSFTPPGDGIFVAGQVVHPSGTTATLPDLNRTTEISFDSSLDTWWTLSDNAAVWAENPWLITYVDNTDTTPSLKMTPRWEWTDSDTNHKSGPQVQVYKSRVGTVSDFRSRIRGKGRALQLHFEGEQGKPFNLLAWTINLDKNAQF